MVLINIVIIRDTNFPLFINKFLEDFARYTIATLIDFFSRYNQVELHIDSRPLVAFITPNSFI